MFEQSATEWLVTILIKGNVGMSANCIRLTLINLLDFFLRSRALYITVCKG